MTNSPLTDSHIEVVMKKLFLLVSFSLTACGTVQNAQLNNAAQNAQIEIAQKCNWYLHLSDEEAWAWIKSGESIRQCAKGYKEPWPRTEMMFISSCGEKIMEKNIQPVAYSKKNFSKLMKEREDEHRKYAKGEISWTEMNELGASRMNKYMMSSDKGSYFSYANCHNTIMDKEIFPTYPAQLRPLLVEYATNLAQFSRKADKKNLPIEDYQIGYQRIWSDFVNKEQQKIGHLHAQNAQAWQNYSQRLQQMSQQVMQAERQNAGEKCAYNPSSNTYQKCLHFNAAGQCVHYGAPCQP